VPKVLADDERNHEILDEFRSASPEIIITLGDQPLKWFVRKVSNERRSRLADYSASDAAYGRLHYIEIDGRKLQLLPLVHPRQAARLGRYSPVWFKRHDEWKLSTAPSLKSMF
jgi:uracil-DNA glycosylase